MRHQDQASNALVQITENESPTKQSQAQHEDKETNDSGQKAVQSPKGKERLQVTSVKKHKRANGCQLSFALAKNAAMTGATHEKVD